jgi:hypothetical protein
MHRLCCGPPCWLPARTGQPPFLLLRETPEHWQRSVPGLLARCTTAQRQLRWGQQRRRQGTQEVAFRRASCTGTSGTPSVTAAYG